MKRTSIRPSPSKTSAVCTAVALSLLLSACGSGPASGDWAATVTDSAGVSIVSNPDRGLWHPSEVPAAEVVLRIGEIEGEPMYQFGQITALNVDAEGNIYVGDSQAREIRVFDPSGRFLRQIGRPGSGPGELGIGGVSVLFGSGDTLFAPDPAQQRVNIFLRDGTFVRSFAIPMTEGISAKWAVTPAGELLQQIRYLPLPGMQQEDGPDIVLRRGSDGVIQDTVLVLEGGMKVRFVGGGAPAMMLFEPESIWEIMRDGRFLMALNSDYRIELYSAAGELERVIRKSFERQTLEATDRDIFLDAIRKSLDRQEMPPELVQLVMHGISFADHYPAFMTIMEGPEGSIWVQQITTARQISAKGEPFSPEHDLGAPEWDVFDRAGRYLGVVTFPPRFQMRVVRGNRIYGTQTDELDVQYVVAVEVGGEFGGP